MELKEKCVIKGVICHTVKTFNKLVSSDKVIELLNNLDDYKDKNGKLDIESIKEDLLNYRENIVKLNDTYSPIGMSCTCKGYYFKKGKCRHINWVLEHKDEKIS